MISWTTVFKKIIISHYRKTSDEDLQLIFILKCVSQKVKVLKDIFSAE